MADKQRYGIALTLLASACACGCSTGTSWLAPSSWWGGQDAKPANGLANNAPSKPAFAPSTSGATAKLGSPPATESGPFSTMTASFKKWSGQPETKPSTEVDALSLDQRPKIKPDLYAQMARMYEAKGDFDGAIAQYEQALKLNPKDTQLLCSLGRAYDRKGDFAKAMLNYQQALKIDPRSATAYCDLGLCYARQGDRDRSIEYLRQAVAIDPQSQLYRNNLATVLVDLGRYDEAYMQLSAVLQPPAAHYNVGYLAYRKGDKAEAMRRFNQATQLDPNFAAARKMADKVAGVASQIPSRQQIEQQAQQRAQQATDRVVKQANQVSTQASQTLLDAEAKLRANLEAKRAAIAPMYGADWGQTSAQATPRSDNSIEPPPAELTSGKSAYSLDDDSSEAPILLPPTGE